MKRLVLGIILIGLVPSLAFGATMAACAQSEKELQPSPLNISFLPSQIPMRIGRPDAAEYFRGAKQAWDQQYDPQFLRTALGKLAAGDTSFLTKENKKRLKAIRKASDALRTAFLILDRSHEGPDKLRSFVAGFGDLDDTIDTAIKRGFNDKINARIASEAKALHKELKDLDFAKQLDKFRPAGRKSIRQDLEKLAGKTRNLMAAQTLSNDEFHTVRKAVRKLGKVFGFMAVRSGAPETQAVSDYLLELSHVLGKIHAEAVSDDITGVRSYVDTRVTLPPDLRQYLQAFLDRVRID